ncbi:MAG: DNA modification methylase [Candidatus Peribacteraceae bacterium]|nr:DNA modification methylase [Candidatus Peribacteraceae bacterium]
MATRRRNYRKTHSHTTAPPSDLRIVWVPWGVLRAAAYNPRTHNAEQEAQLTESIKRFSVVEPIVVNGAQNRKNIVIGGHFRLEVLRKLGYQTVPVVYVHISSLEREKELNLRLNRNTGEWDWEVLKVFDSDILLDVGFTADELSAAWDGLLETEDDHFDEEKELKKIKKPKAKIGDIWKIGPHRLLCGDATDPAAVRRLMGKEEASMLYIDPPFNIGLSYDKGLSHSKAYGGRTNDKKSEEDYRTFLKAIIGNALAAGKKDLHCFFWCDENWTWLVQELYRELGITHRRLCAWVKGNFSLTPGIAFNKAMEIAVYGTVGSPYLAPTPTNLSEILDKEVGSGTRQIDDILSLFQIWACQRIHSTEYQHPTQKPPTLHEKPLRRCTKPGDIVLDLTAGSGSTMVACHQMKRRAFLCEIEPVFCDLILERAKALGLTSSPLRP